MFNRFDIVEAYYLAYCHCHGGQWSVEYSKLCKIQKYFTPGRNLSVETLSDNGKEIYDTVCAKLLAYY